MKSNTGEREYVYRWAFFLRIMSGDRYREGRTHYTVIRLLGIPFIAMRSYIP